MNVAEGVEHSAFGVFAASDAAVTLDTFRLIADFDALWIFGVESSAVILTTERQVVVEFSSSSSFQLVFAWLVRSRTESADDLPK